MLPFIRELALSFGFLSYVTLLKPATLVFVHLHCGVAFVQSLHFTFIGSGAPSVWVCSAAFCEHGGKLNFHYNHCFQIF